MPLNGLNRMDGGNHLAFSIGVASRPYHQNERIEPKRMGCALYEWACFEFSGKFFVKCPLNKL